MRQDFHAEIDFHSPAGVFKKRVHGSNSAPRLATRGFFDFKKEFQSMHFTEARTHDWALWNPGQRIIDTHFIFPLMKLDPKDPSNYFFDASDDMISMCLESGSQIYYRLGTSIEHTGPIHHNTHVPEDFEKYAEVLAGIVRHYTRGWANGFHHDIRYWEIWNEAGNGPSMWSGSTEEYEKFFFIVFRRLKREFPELKIGGPAYCEYEENTYRAFLDRCRAAEIVPDFLSYHHYTSNDRVMIDRPKAVRALLDSYGFNRTEIHITEWHYIVTWEGLQKYVTPAGYRNTVYGETGMQGINSAVFNLASLIGWQDSPVDAAHYYGGSPEGAFGFYSQEHGFNLNYDSMRMFGEFLAHSGKRVETKTHGETLYSLGSLSEDGKTGTMLLADYRGSERTLNISVRGMEDAFAAVELLDTDHHLIPVPSVWNNGILTLSKNAPGSAAWRIVFERKS